VRVKAFLLLAAAALGIRTAVTGDYLLGALGVVLLALVIIVRKHLLGEVDEPT